MITDNERLDFIEQRARLSRTGISFEWDGHDGYRYNMEHNKLGEKCRNIREAIDREINKMKITGEMK